MSKRLEILKKSLAKKEQELQRRLDEHFATVKQANGQPLNDKRNGSATLKKWEKQNDGIRNVQTSIEKTKQAIEIEGNKVLEVELSKKYIPKEILQLVESGELIQWRKYPHTFFVHGVDKARIVWIEKTKQVAHKFLNEIPTIDQRKKFAQVFNLLAKQLKK